MYWFIILQHLVVIGLIKVEIKTHILVSWPNCGGIIITCKVKSVHVGLLFCQTGLTQEEIKPFTLITWPSCNKVIVKRKLSLAHYALPWILVVIGFIEVHVVPWTLIKSPSFDKVIKTACWSTICQVVMELTIWPSRYN